MIESDDYAYLKDTELCPCVFQELVPKSLEYRITVIGDKVFAAVLDTQTSELTRIDWRRGIGKKIACRAAKLPPKLEEKSIAIVHSFGLQFATMDVIFTPQDEYVFLDLNPNGQWIWVELETGMPMMECFARFLTLAD